MDIDVNITLATLHSVDNFFRSCNDIRFSDFRIFSSRLYPKEDLCSPYVCEKYDYCRNNFVSFYLSLNTNGRLEIIKWVKDIQSNIP